MRRTIVAGAVIGLIAAIGVTAPAQASPATHPVPKATVGLFHGVPNTPVDVYLGKTRIADDFQPGTFVGGLQVDGGTYTVRITAADATSWKHPIVKSRVSFKGGKNYSVIAHLTKRGAPTVTKYRNDVSPVQHGQARVTVRHVAAAPAVDVRADGKRIVSWLKNPREAVLTAPVGTYSTKVTLAGSKKAVLGPVDLTLAKDTNTIVYAWGSAKDGTLALTPRVVPTQPRP
ncbi:DUF4397 domain-containing protein [uncultured Amnibacterium sp.]|uniref:DUF4397 domain-containing protein n=1 Tax=uncultured Amnibacterium sp. TaxID=1631851 RepID=UPI0035CAE8DA